MTSYQKLKKENEQLKKDLAIMVFWDRSFIAQDVSRKYKLKKGFGEWAWLGERRSDNYLKGGVIKPETIHGLIIKNNLL